MKTMYSPLNRANWPRGGRGGPPEWEAFHYYTKMLSRLSLNAAYWVRVSTPSFDHGNNEPYMFQIFKIREGLHQEELFRTYDIKELLPMLKLLVGSLEDERKSHE